MKCPKCAKVGAKLVSQHPHKIPSHLKTDDAPAWTTCIYECECGMKFTRVVQVLPEEPAR